MSNSEASTPKTRISVLGGGRVGSYIARRLARDLDLDVTLWDRDADAAERAADGRVRFECADLSRPGEVERAAGAADVVLGALPGALGFAAARVVLETGRDLVDISFFPEDARALEPLARERGLRAVVDCGVMPGLGGMLALHLCRQLDEAEEASIMVGGLPIERRWPTEYLAPFSPADVIEEYTRPARFRVAGRVVTRPALSDVELVDLPEIGTLEAFATDGLRTLLDSLDVPDLREKTLRYPGHAERMRLLRHLGFFDTEPREVDGQSVVPLALTSRLLEREWALGPSVDELTVMRVEAAGRHGDRRRVLRCDLLDRTDPDTGDSSMARTTGMPAVLATRLVVERRLERFGLIPGEQLAAEPGVFDWMLNELAAERIVLRFTEQEG